MPTIDPYELRAKTPDDPLRNAMEITPSDTQNLSVRPTWLWIETPKGSEELQLRMQMENGPVTLTFAGDGNRVTLKMSPLRILATGTVNAARIVIFW